MIKAITGTDYLFEFVASQPINGTPSITIQTSTPSTLALTQSRANATVSAIANDRRTLTVDSQATGLQADQVNAFLITNADTIYPVAVVRIVGTTAILSEPLPREIDLSTSAVLEFALWSVVLPGASVTSASGTYSYSISHVVDGGQYTQSRLSSGVIKVTPRPFDTGLTHEVLVNTLPLLADLVPRRQSSFNPQIKAGLDEMSTKIRMHLSADSLTEDEVFNAYDFQLSHLYCVAAIIMESNLKLDIANAYRQRCADLLQIALDLVAIDKDGDGVVDDGEVDQNYGSGGASDFRASFKGYVKPDSDKTFTPTRSMRH